MTVLDNLHRIPAPTLPDVPAQVLLDAARAYVDANAALNRIGTNDTLQEAAARAVVTSQLLHAAVATAYAAGKASVMQDGETAYDWATRWTHADGDTTVMSANSAGASAEHLARKRAKQVMRDVGPGEAVRRLRYTGPWLPVVAAGEEL